MSLIGRLGAQPEVVKLESGIALSPPLNNMSKLPGVVLPYIGAPLLSNSVIGVGLGLSILTPGMSVLM